MTLTVAAGTLLAVATLAWLAYLAYFGGPVCALVGCAPDKRTAMLVRRKSADGAPPRSWAWPCKRCDGFVAFDPDPETPDDHGSP